VVQVVSLLLQVEREEMVEKEVKTVVMAVMHHPNLGRRRQEVRMEKLVARRQWEAWVQREGPGHRQEATTGYYGRPSCYHHLDLRQESGLCRPMVP
jgi:hypothetical protein